MMNEPSIEKLTKEGRNRYEICIATAKIARELINSYNEEDREIMAEDRLMGKKPIRDDKPLKTAVRALDEGEYEIVEGKQDIVDIAAEEGEEAPLSE